MISYSIQESIGLRSIKNKGYKTVNEFYKALTFVNKILYEPNHLTINAIREEAQNSDYGAARG
ncbi:mep operon protein MepB, partial [Bacillus haynesii]|nr:mep operon protein MepB [Bacillus haynesii]